MERVLELPSPFSIISILSGCFTTFGQANNGGPIAIRWAGC
jgi:hypothetical protein